MLAETRHGIDEVEDAEDDGVSVWFDLPDQVRPVRLDRLVLALEGTRGGKKPGVFAREGLGSGSNRFFAWLSGFPLQAGTRRETSDKESLTK